MSIAATIIIPCFNAARTMTNLADSVGRLLSDEIEAIIVDDGSTDGSSNLAQKLMPQATVIEQSNQGAGVARNVGARLARGEFLQFLDADDTIEANKLQRQIAYARLRGADVVYSDWRMVLVGKKGITSLPVVRAEPDRELVEALLGGWWVPVHAHVVRRETYWSIGGWDESLLNTGDDFDLMLRLAIAGKRIDYLPGFFASYYRFEGVISTSNRNRRQFWQGTERIIEKGLNQLEAMNALSNPRRRAAARQLFHIAQNVYVMDRAWFERLLARVYELDPEFRPGGSLQYRLSARVLGIRRTERIASLKRK